MNLLILGGTAFLGRHLVTAAVEKNHNLTLFHRGNRNPFPALENILGNRETDLELLAGRTWDAVIDTSAYIPRVTKISAAALQDKVQRYCFISTISVYKDFLQAHDELAAVATLEQDTEEVTGATYGALKALCENEISAAFGQLSLNLRPGLIVGQFDPSDRFTYWVERIARGGDVIAPGNPTAGVQFIDALSLARFTIHALEQNLSGTYNLNGQSIAMQHVLETICKTTQSAAQLHWVSDEFLAEQKVNAWMGTDSLPLWIPNADTTTNGTIIKKALEAGLTFRPLEEIILEVLAFAQTRKDYVWRSGITAEREAALVALHQSR